jgi:hypothetical protein
MKRSNGFKVGAAIILALTFLFWLIFSVIGILQGVPREINNLILIIIMALLGLLAWKRPLLGGILLAVLAVLMAIYFLMFNDYFSTALVGMVLLGAPAVIAGFLFIDADWAKKKMNSN